MIKVYAVQMSYNVTDSEKQQAETALLRFNNAARALENASDHLNIMKTPFKDNLDTTPDDIMNARAAIRRFRDKVADNFNIFKNAAFNCVNSMQPFSSDTQTLKIMKAFIASIDELEGKVNKFMDLFNDLKQKDFATNIVKSIEGIQLQCSDINDLIQDRIKPHIHNNILSASWVDSVGNNLQMSIKKKKPLMLELSDNAKEEH